MEFEPNVLYQLEVSTTNYTECVGCILRGCSHDRTVGTVVHKSHDCWDKEVCGIAESETWVEITEEQAMEVMLGG